MELQLKHLAPYLANGVEVYYKGIINGKELGAWERKYKDYEFFQEPEEPKPNEIMGWRTGKIKGIETPLKYWKLRVGNGRKNVFPRQFGKDAFLLLLPLSSLTTEQCILDEFFNDFGGGVSESAKSNWLAVEIENIQNSAYTSLSYGFVEWLLERHFDVFGLINAGLAIDKRKHLNR